MHVCQSESVQRFDVVVVGSANLDLVVTVDRLPMPGETITALAYAEYAGGKGVNQAIAAARMGARTAFIGCVGDDAAGETLRDVLRGDGVDVTGLLTVSAPTGRALINVEESGENSIVVVPGANAMLQPNRLPDAGVVLTQLEIPLATVMGVMADAHERGIMTVLNPAPARELPVELLRLVDVIVPNEHECELLGGSAVLLRSGVRSVVTTLGARGVEVTSRAGVVEIPAHPVRPVDTVGAGDAFTGAFCAELAVGASIEHAVGVGAVAGALATTVRGAVPSLPRREAVVAAMGGHGS
jgi:ribokinase